jgi:hypothetical protein
MMQARPLEVDVFNGGITDNYLDGNPTKYKEADNLIVTFNRKLYTRPGSEIQDATMTQIPVGAQRIGSLRLFRGELLENSARKIFYKDVSYQTLQGPSSNDVLSTGTINNYLSYADFNNQLMVTSDAFPSVMKIFKDGGGTLQVRNAGLPDLASSPTVTPGAGANNYIYAFFYEYTYTVEDKTFVDEGPTTLVQITNADAPDSTTVAITAIPVLSNGATENYDTANIKVKIYRTIAGGSVFYEVGEVTNGTTTFNDTQSDTAIQLNSVIYTNDGTLDAEAPPLCKYVHTTNQLTFYAHIKEGSETLENVVQQSFPNNFDSTNALLRVEVDEEITGLSSWEFTPIVFCTNSIFRLDGAYNQDGTGLLTAQRISDRVGCVSNQSIVRTKKGTYFAGNDGFYWTDGYRHQKVSEEFNVRYMELVKNNPERILGAYDRENDRVLWSVQQDGGSADNDKVYVLDLRYGIKEDSCFTTWSGGDSFAPSAIEFLDDNTLIRADRRGYTFRHDTDIYTDPKIEVGTAVANWVKQTIIFNYESCAYDFGTTFIRKWVTRCNVICDSETNLALQITSINDDGRKTSELKPIEFNNAIIWGDEDVTWGTASLIWNFDGLIDEWRRFPARGIRCNYKQIKLSNAYVETATSEVDGQVTVDNTAKTATLVNSSVADFPSNSVDYEIFFSADNFTQGYTVTTRNPDTVVYSDGGNLSPSGTFDWKMKGYPKNQVLNLIGYTIHFSMVGKTQTPYTG